MLLYQVDDGSGITATLIPNGAKYHKLRRSRCRSSHVKRGYRNIEEQVDRVLQKNLRQLGNLTLQVVMSGCVVCAGTNQDNLHEVATAEMSTA